MSTTAKADAVLERVYLEVRAKLLEVGALLDRIERSEGAGQLAGDQRLQQFQETLAILQSPGTDRAERIQMLFSDPYVPNWKRK